MGNATFEQADFSAGIYRGRKAPRNAVYDALNALVDDEGQLFKRGGSVFKSNANAGTTLVGLAEFIAALNPVTAVRGQVQTVAWSTSAVYGLRYADDATPVSIGGGVTQFPRPFARGAGVGSTFVLPTASPTSNQVVSISASTTEPAAANVTLANPPVVEYVTAVGTPARLVVTQQNKAWFSDPGIQVITSTSNIPSTNVHELQQNAQIIGADSLGNTLVLFTTQGVYVVRNMELDPVDDFGNVQHQVVRVGDLILWGDPGITGYAGRLVVPAIDDVWLFSPGAVPQSISGDAGDEKIRPLYRSYVKAGYQPGMAAVHRGHYFLPIMNGTTLVDVLVCRLDRGAAWTRLSGHAAGGAYAVRTGNVTRSPKLWGINAQRFTDLTGIVDGPAANSTDADGTTATFQVDTVDFDTGPGIRPNTVEKVRTVYEMAGSSPTISVSYATGLEGASYTAGILKRGGGASDGTDYTAHRVGKKAERIRFRISCSSTVTSLILRRVEVTVRQAAQS